MRKPSSEKGIQDVQFFQKLLFSLCFYLESSEGIEKEQEKKVKKKINCFK